MDIQTLEDERRRAIQAQGDLRMGVSGGWNVASSNLNQPGESAPYTLFRAPKDPYDEPGWGFGVDKTGQGFFEPIPPIPFNERVQNPETNDMMIANARLPFINIDNLEDPVGTLRDGGYPDPDVLDFPSGGYYRKGSDVLDKLIDLELVKQNPNDMMISWVKNVGDELTPQEVMDGLRIIDNTETNLLKKRLRLDRMMNNNPPKA